jgi:hypothetical protein
MDALLFADLLIRVLELVVPVAARQSDALHTVRAMVAEGREPSRAEWDAVFISLRFEVDRLDAAVARLEALQNAPGRAIPE